MKIHLDIENIIEYVEDEEYILIDMMKNKFYSLDYIGSIIWRKLIKGKNMDYIVNYLSEKSGIENSIIKNDVLSFLNSMNEKGLITIEY